MDWQQFVIDAKQRGTQLADKDIYNHDGYVVKLGLQESIDNQLLNEIQLLSRLDHPNIIKLYAHGFDMTHQDQLYMVLPCYIGDLYELIGALHQSGSSWEHRLPTILHDMVAPVNYLHDLHIIHCDIKPENYLVGPEGLVLADFGLALCMGDMAPYKVAEVCTIPYRERRLLGDSCDYGCEIDMWALGCTIYELLCNKVLFERWCAADMLVLIDSQLGSDHDPIKFIPDERWRLLVSNLVCLDVAARWTAKDCLRYLGDTQITVPLSTTDVLSMYTVEPPAVITSPALAKLKNTAPLRDLP